MFTIDVYAAKLPEGGIGLFAGAAAPAGEKIWRFVRGFDRIYQRDHLAGFPERIQGFVRAHGFETPVGWVLGADHDLFMRVSRTPNVIFHRDRLILTLSDAVAAGSELTCQHRALDGSAGQQAGAS